MVSAPLRLTNQLPIAGSLLVWEQQVEAGKGNLVGRETVQVASGATVPIHTGEARGGCWAGVCGGFAGQTARQESAETWPSGSAKLCCYRLEDQAR